MIVMDAVRDVKEQSLAEIAERRKMLYLTMTRDIHLGISLPPQDDVWMTIRQLQEQSSRKRESRCRNEQIMALGDILEKVRHHKPVKRRKPTLRQLKTLKKSYEELSEQYERRRR